MPGTIDYRPQIEWLNTALLDMAGVQSVDALLDLIVRRLAETEPVALARLWLLEKGDICDRCHMRPECPDQTHCLHLVASAGDSRAEPDADWSRLDGFFRRFPLGVRKVGLIGASGKPLGDRRHHEGLEMDRPARLGTQRGHPRIRGPAPGVPR